MNRVATSKAMFGPASARLPVPAALCGIAAIYLVAIKFSMTMNIGFAVSSMLANVVPLVVLGLGVRQVVRRGLIAQPVAMQLAWHLPLSMGFALTWYWALMVLLGLQGGHSWTSFQVRPIFSNPAIAWMLVQGLTFYALIVALSHLEARGAPRPAPEPAPPRGELPRYFIRDADAIRPVDAREIVSIRGAGDYVEVTTDNGRHLARRTLAEFEALLKAGGFIRVHRAVIVNLERIAHAEPAGDGRMLIHMVNGEAIQTSRVGAKALRAHVI